MKLNLILCIFFSACVGVLFWQLCRRTYDPVASVGMSLAVYYLIDLAVGSGFRAHSAWKRP